MMNDFDLLEQFQKERRLKPKTLETYKNTVKNYTTFMNKSMVELIEEAELEEEQGIRWIKRKLRQRLIDYRVYLLDTMKLATVKTYFNRLKTVYRHFGIEIHDLPAVSTKDADISKQITYDELITKEEIREAIKVTKPVYRAIILFMLSSGCARAETLNLTIQDFIDSLQAYTKQQDIRAILDELNNRNDIVPTWKLRRIKTNKYYYTFCSPEAVQYIFSYLRSSDRELKSGEPLFKLYDTHLVRVFEKINQQLNFGKAGTYNRFRSHNLRKFHASNLSRGEYPLSPDEIDSLQGRSKDTVRSSYFFDDPEFLKSKYVQNLEQVTINQEVEKINVDDPEVVKIKKEKELLENKLDNLQDSMNEQINDAVKVQIEENMNRNNILELLKKNNII